MKRVTPLVSNEKANRGRTRHRLLILGGAILMLCGLVLLFNSTWFLQWLLRPSLEARFGGPVTIHDASWTGFCDLTVQDLQLQAPGWEQAGPVLRIDEVTVQFQASSLLKLRPHAEVIQIKGGVLRIVESARDPMNFNIDALVPVMSEDDGPTAATIVTIENFMVERGGINLEDHYEENGVITFSGELLPMERTGSRWSFELIESMAGSDPNELSFAKGSFDTSFHELDLTIQNIKFSRAFLDMLPYRMQKLFKSMDLRGAIQKVAVNWSKDSLPNIEVQIDSMELTIPDLGTSEYWARYQDGRMLPEHAAPRMSVDKGTILVDDGRLVLRNLGGSLGSSSRTERFNTVPFRLDELSVDLAQPVFKDLQIEEISAEDMAQLTSDFSAAGFTMNFGIEDFTIEGIDDSTDEELPLEIPRVLARILTNFDVTRGSVGMDAKLERLPPLRGSDGQWIASPITYEGEIRIKKAKGAYFKFPYPLEDVSSTMTFQNDVLTIHRLTGEGPSQSKVHVSGTITEVGDGAGVDIIVESNDAALDQAFIDCFEPAPRRAFINLFDHEAYELMLQDDSFNTSEDIIESGHQLKAINEQLQELARNQPAGHEEIAPLLQIRKEQLERVIDAGPYQIGGRIGFRMRIHRPPGEGGRVIVEGPVQLKKVGVLIQRFPYPLTVQNCGIEIEDQQIVLQETGLIATTSSGGLVRLQGDVLMPRIDGKRYLEATLNITGIQDRLGPSLYRAIPPDGEEIQTSRWPAVDSSRGELLAGLGAEGNIDYSGRIKLNKTGPDQFDFTFMMSDGSIRPDVNLSKTLEEAGMSWPAEFQLSMCTAELRVTESELQMRSFQGHRAGGIVRGSGLMDETTGSNQLELYFRNIQLEEYMVNLLPHRHIEAAHEFWNRFQPSGSFDADLHWRRSAESGTIRNLKIHPNTFTAMIQDEQVRVRRTNGDIMISKDQVMLDELVLQLGSRGAEDGTLTLDGTYGYNDELDTLGIDGSWTEGRFESPFVTESMILVGADELSEQYSRLNPAGRFEATMQYMYEDGDSPPVYELDVRPRQLDLSPDGRLVSIQFEDDSIVTVKPGMIMVRDVSGQFGNTDTKKPEQTDSPFIASGDFSIGGEFQTDDGTHGTLYMQMDADGLDQGMVDLLPGSVATVLRDLDLECNGRLQVSEGVIRIDEDEKMSSAGFSGDIFVDGLDFNGGLAYTDIRGGLDLDLWGDQDRLSTFRLTADIDRILVEDRLLTNGFLDMDFDEITQSIIAKGMNADVYGGRFMGDLEFDIDPGGYWWTSIDVVDADFSRITRGENSQTKDVSSGGRLLASFQLSGRNDDPTSKVGRGGIQIVDGRFANMPLALGLLQITQLMLPLNGSLERGELRFHLDGDILTFDRLELISDTLRLIGEGQMDVQSLEVATRFQSRGNVAVLDEIIGSISDHLFAIEISGNINDPDTSLVPLPGLVKPREISKVPSTEPTPGNP